MFRLTIKELAARKVRLLATAFAVLLGVAFMAGTLVFTDTIGATFDSALADANDGVDAYVQRHRRRSTLGYGEPGPRLDASLVGTVASVDGVDQAALRINGYAQLVGHDGKPVGDVAKSPAFGTNWVTVDDLNPYELRERSCSRRPTTRSSSTRPAPTRPGTSSATGRPCSPRVRPASSPSPASPRSAAADSPAGATAVLFTDATAPASCWPLPDRPTPSPSPPTPVCRRPTLAAAVRTARWPADDVEVITGATLIEEDQAALARRLQPVQDDVMLVFAFVAVFVGAFIINNTFSITVAQRTREMAMLRAIGASPAVR